MGLTGMPPATLAVLGARPAQAPTAVARGNNRVGVAGLLAISNPTSIYRRFSATRTGSPICEWL